MDLREYLFRKRITIAEFSRNINYTPEYLGAVIHKKTKPGKKLAKAIEKATNGEVTVEELMALKEIDNEQKES